jgi:hypothetical protein
VVAESTSLFLKNIRHLKSEKMKEIWKTIKGYEGYYEASNMGNIRSVDRIILSTANILHTEHKQFRKGKILKQGIGRKGYKIISLQKEGKRKTVYTHRIIASTFIENIDNKPCIDHINGIHTDNRAENLRWCTQKENINNPNTINKNIEILRQNNIIGCKPKTIIQLDKDSLKIIREIPPRTSFFKEMGYTRGYITAACRNRKQNAYGYKWAFKEDFKIHELNTN